MKDYSKDTRESPSLKFLELAKKHFKEVSIYDKEVEIDLNEKVDSIEKALKDSDVLVIPILQNFHKDLKIEFIKNLMNENPLVVDIKKLFDVDELNKFGIKYIVLKNIIQLINSEYNFTYNKI